MMLCQCHDFCFPRPADQGAICNARERVYAVLIDTLRVEVVASCEETYKMLSQACVTLELNMREALWEHSEAQLKQELEMTTLTGDVEMPADARGSWEALLTVQNPGCSLVHCGCWLHRCLPCASALSLHFCV